MYQSYCGYLDFHVPVTGRSVSASSDSDSTYSLPSLCWITKVCPSYAPTPAAMMETAGALSSASTSIRVTPSISSGFIILPEPVTIRNGLSRTPCLGIGRPARRAIPPPPTAHYRPKPLPVKHFKPALWRAGRPDRPTGPLMADPRGCGAGSAPPKSRVHASEGQNLVTDRRGSRPLSAASASWTVAGGSGRPMAAGIRGRDRVICPRCGSKAPILSGFASHVTLTLGEDGLT